MLWPFLRIVQDFGPEIDMLRAAGVDPDSLSDPDERIPRRLLGEIIWAAVQRTGDVALGVHAGEKTESADFGVMDLTVRACPDMNRAMQCIARYVRLQDDNVEMSLSEDGDRVLWQFRNAVPPVLRVTNDFQVTIAIVNLRRRLGRSVPSANPEAYALFDVRASRLLKELDRADTTTAKVRRLVANRIGREGIGIVEIGAQLHMSEATLRRRLDEEGTTYKAIVDALRQELASQYIAERRVAIGEIAFLLGFSTQSAFGRAFRRWTGGSPLEHRLRLKEATRRAS
jgi:AraC-like DNA-binding protein